MKKSDLYRAARRLEPGPNLQAKLAAAVANTPPREWPRRLGIAVATCVLAVVVAVPIWVSQRDSGGSFTPGAGGTDPASYEDEPGDLPSPLPTVAPEPSPEPDELHSFLYNGERVRIVSTDWLTEVDEDGYPYITGITTAFTGVHDDISPHIGLRVSYDGVELTYSRLSHFDRIDCNLVLLPVDGEDMWCPVYDWYFENSITAPGVYEYILVKDYNYADKLSPPRSITIPEKPEQED